MREYLFHPDRFGILTLSGLCAVAFPIMILIGVSPLVFQIVFGAIVVFSFGGMVWLTNLEARGELRSQKRNGVDRGGFGAER